MDPLILLVIVLLILWVLGGFVFVVGTNLVHLLLVIALVVLVIRLLQGRKIF